MLSSSIKLLVRSQCYRSLHTALPSIREQQLLQLKPNFAKNLISNVRFVMKKRDPFEEVDPEDAAKMTEKKIRRKTPEIPKITLLDGNDKLSICTLEEAIKIAEGRKLRLIKIIDMDVRSKRPIYKLMSEAQYLEEELSEKKKRKDNQNSSLKGEKILILSCRITENDLRMKLNNANKWLGKNFEVRVTISGPNSSMEEQERVYLEFENVFKEKARFLQKRNKGGDIKFQLTPLENASALDHQKKSPKQRNKSKTIHVEEEDLEEKNEVGKSEESSPEQTKHNILSKM